MIFRPFPISSSSLPSTSPPPTILSNTTALLEAWAPVAAVCAAAATKYPVAASHNVEDESPFSSSKKGEVDTTCDGPNKAFGPPVASGNAWATCLRLYATALRADIAATASPSELLFGPFVSFDGNAKTQKLGVHSDSSSATVAPPPSLSLPPPQLATSSSAVAAGMLVDCCGPFFAEQSS
eukprot:CAMPEP_0178635822 /NCGR_PEP_ID=MMETSP0698-20121128/13387_1 /TAXON_ID=265572 /ORGANISM="Extubocellulus spinifer, Strain CCMP396" /LENGTH=180 /DNA_ID=CAMNT_0020275619 /DNA_START=159 /DNA_END=696 /DNA_ORIENTATION=-